MPDPVLNPTAPPVTPSATPEKFAGKYTDDAAAFKGVNEIRKQIGLGELSADKPLYGENGHFRDRAEAESRYKEHETVFHATRKPTAAPSDLGIKADDKIEDEAPATVLERAGITPADAVKAIEAGALTPEQIAKIRQTTPSYKNLSDAKINLIAKGHYAEEQARGAERAKYFAKGTEIVGDEAKHNALREWAKANIPADELARFSKVAATDPALYPMIVRELNARYTASIGAAGTKPIVQGTNNGASSMPTNRKEFGDLMKKVNSGDPAANATLARMTDQQIAAFN